MIYAILILGNRKSRICNLTYLSFINVRICQEPLESTAFSFDIASINELLSIGQTIVTLYQSVKWENIS